VGHESRLEAHGSVEGPLRGVGVDVAEQQAASVVVGAGRRLVAGATSSEPGGGGGCGGVVLRVTMLLDADQLELVERDAEAHDAVHVHRAIVAALRRRRRTGVVDCTQT